MNTEQQETENVQPSYPNLNILLPTGTEKELINKGIFVGRLLCGDLAKNISNLREDFQLKGVPIEIFLASLSSERFYSEETPFDLYTQIFGVTMVNVPETIEKELDWLAWSMMNL